MKDENEAVTSAKGKLPMLTKDEFLEPLARLRGDSVVVTCMGVTRPWGKRSHVELDFASADSAMGHTADLALGIALARPERKVICLNGDGSMLMTLGTLVTATQAAARNYYLFIIQNDTYEITGNLPIPGAGKVDFGVLARGAGFTSIYEFDHAASYTASLPAVLGGEGPVLVVAKVEPGTEGPISRSAKEASLYLKESLAEWARRMRRALNS
jgi:thiamine pyrophosphate-dependent acetolactate synthase large subunit-like protein